MLKSTVIKLCCLAVMAVNCLPAAEEVDLSSPRDWLQEKALTTVDGALRAKGILQLHSKKIFPAVPGKIYRLLGSFKMVSGTASAPIHYGVLPLDERKQPLYAVNEKTGTFLSAEAKPGDRELKIADAKNWLAARNIQIVLAPGTPAEKVLKVFPVKLEKGSGKITLSGPLAASAAINTPVAVRQKVPALYFAVERSSAKGLTDPAATSKEIWHPGIKYFRVLILANWKNMPAGQPVPELEMRNLKLQIQ